MSAVREGGLIHAGVFTEPFETSGLDVQMVQDWMSAVGDGGPGLVVLICLLGGFHLLARGIQPQIRGRGKTEALLTYLGLAGRRGMSREELTAAIWPAKDTALAQQALKTLIRAVRDVLGAALGGASPVVYQAGAYRLNQEAGVGVDLGCFEALASAGDHLLHRGRAVAASDAYARAVQLYAGDLAPLPNEPVDISLERERLRARYLNLLARLAQQALVDKNYDLCLAYAGQLLGFDPGREDAHRAMMRCYVRLGQRAQALRHFRTAQSILRLEYGMGPEPATLALFRQIRVDPTQV
jgi:DNA-binding SARP family transcriptional activator